jgi:hypothetical protein
VLVTTQIKSSRFLIHDPLHAKNVQFSSIIDDAAVFGTAVLGAVLSLTLLSNTLFRIFLEFEAKFEKSYPSCQGPCLQASPAVLWILIRRF